MNKTPKWTRFWNIREHSAGGFTLVELIVVIAILAILAGVAVPAYSGYIKKAEQAADEQLLAALNTAYAAACMENGKYNMKDLGFTPVASLTKTGVRMSEYNDSFQNYFGSGVFKYYDVLGFDGTEGVFKGNTKAVINAVLQKIWPNTSFGEDPEAVQNLLETFDGIGYIFGIGANGDIEEYREGLLGKVSGPIADTLGLTAMFNGLSNAMSMTDAEVDSLLRERYGDSYDTMTEDKKKDLRAGVRGNAAVMHFANDTSGRTVEEVLSSVNAFTDAIYSSYGKTFPGSAEDLKDDPAYMEKAEKYYLSVANASELAAYNDPDANKAQILSNFLNSTAAGAGDDFKLTGAQLVAISDHIGSDTSGTNSTGITSLGAMYALAAGYYSSKYYEGDSKPTDYGNFDTVEQAMGDPKFSAYMGSEECKADLEAYLAFMGSLSAGDVDLTDPNAFANQNDYISGIIGGIQ